MRSLRALLYLGCLLSGTAVAQSLVALTVDTKFPGKPVPENFIGLSFETGSLQYNSSRVNGYLFDSRNKQLLRLFKKREFPRLCRGGSRSCTPCMNDSLEV